MVVLQGLQKKVQEEGGESFHEELGFKSPSKGEKKRPVQQAHFAFLAKIQICPLCSSAKGEPASGLR